MPATVRDDPERRWAAAERDLAPLGGVGRGRRTVALVLTVVWVVLLAVLIVTIVIPVPAVPRSAWQVTAAAGLVLLGVVAALHGAATAPGALLRRVAPTAGERRAVRQQLAGRAPIPARRRAVLDAVAVGDRATGLLLLAAIVTYYLGYLAGLRADGTAAGAVALPIISIVFATLAIVPAKRLITATRYLRRAIAQETPR